jgi:hypothetical protein
LGNFQALKSWARHLDKLSLQIIDKYKDNKTVPKWFRNLLIEEYAKRKKPNLWSMIWNYKKIIEQIVQALKSPENPIGILQKDSDIEKLKKIQRYVNIILLSESESSFQCSESMNATLNSTMDTDMTGEQTSFIISLVSFMITYGISYSINKWRGLSSENARFLALIVAAIFES